MISSLISIKITFDRVLFLFKGEYKQKLATFYVSIFVFMFVSFLLFLPHVIFTEIRFKYQPETNHSNKTTPFLILVQSYSVSQNSFLMFVYSLVQFLPHAVTILSSLVLNTILIIQIKRKFRQKYNNFEFRLNRISERDKTRNRNYNEYMCSNETLIACRFQTEMIQRSYHATKSLEIIEILSIK